MKYLQKIRSPQSDSHKKLSTLKLSSDKNRNSLNKYSINEVSLLNNNINNKNVRNVFKFSTQITITSPNSKLNLD